MTELQEQIISLRQFGKSYRQICKELGCSKSTVSYLLGKGQKQKTLDRQNQRRKNLHPFYKKKDRFLYSGRETSKSKKLKTKADQLLYQKVQDFQKGGNIQMFTVEDLIQRFGESPRCYLTGDVLDIYDPSSYHFDHIKPISKGGDNSLNNLGICTKHANMAKSDMTLEQFYELCEKVLKHKETVVGIEPT